MMLGKTKGCQFDFLTNFSLYSHILLTDLDTCFKFTNNVITVFGLIGRIGFDGGNGSVKTKGCQFDF